MSRFVDRVGVKYNQLLVDSYSHKKNGRHFWNCICSCGNSKVIVGDNLKSGHTKSCGCARNTHGMHKTSEYQSWESMRQRCNNVNHVSFYRYGKIGISVCDEWNSFARFYSDMGKKPGSTFTIDRIDSEKGYFYGNCRWATKAEQNINKKPYSKGKIQEKGVYEKGGKYLAFLTRGGVQKYIGTFESPALAISARNKHVCAVEGVVKRFSKK